MLPNWHLLGKETENKKVNEYEGKDEQEFVCVPIKKLVCRLYDGHVPAQAANASRHKMGKGRGC